MFLQYDKFLGLTPVKCCKGCNRPLYLSQLSSLRRSSRPRTVAAPTRSGKSDRPSRTTRASRRCTTRACRSTCSSLGRTRRRLRPLPSRSSPSTRRPPPPSTSRRRTSTRISWCTPSSDHRRVQTRSRESKVLQSDNNILP